mmetsp:Transcript_60757/g.172704  ORF Transcript_60757/g.172704 Transcript_60757/m.172704 type:complete len:200 (+) Transcript_60757:112-711(+)
MGSCCGRRRSSSGRRARRWAATCGWQLKRMRPGCRPSRRRQGTPEARPASPSRLPLVREKMSRPAASARRPRSRRCSRPRLTSARRFRRCNGPCSPAYLGCRRRSMDSDSPSAARPSRPWAPSRTASPHGSRTCARTRRSASSTSMIRTRASLTAAGRIGQHLWRWRPTCGSCVVASTVVQVRPEDLDGTCRTCLQHGE